MNIKPHEISADISVRYREILQMFPNGGDYQEMLDKFAENGMWNEALALIDKYGQKSDFRKIDKFPKSDRIFFAGSVETKENLLCYEILVAGNFLAGGSILTEEAIDIRGDLIWTSTAKQYVKTTLETYHYLSVKNNLIWDGDICVKKVIDVGGDLIVNGDVIYGSLKVKGEIKVNGKLKCTATHLDL